jgi:hypothetical protein
VLYMFCEADQRDRRTIASLEDLASRSSTVHYDRASDLGCLTKGNRNTGRFKNWSAGGSRNNRREYKQRRQIFHDLTDGQNLKMIYTKKRM